MGESWRLSKHRLGAPVNKPFGAPIGPLAGENLCMPMDEAIYEQR